MNKFLLCLLCSVLFSFFYSCGDKNPSSTPNSGRDSTGPQVPDGYEIEVAAGPELLDFPMFATLDETGRLFVFESTGNVYVDTKEALDTPQFRIKLLIDTSGDGVYDKMSIFADTVGFPQGGIFYKGSLYASDAPDLLKLTDTDNDGIADKREVILSGWKLNVNANSLVGPVMAPDGWLYMQNAIEGFDVTSKEGKRMKGETARMWRMRPDGSDLEWVSAGGMNNPVELTFTAAGEAIGTETYFTDPQGGERDALVYWIEGGVYPKPNDNITRDKLVRTGELMPVVSKYSRVAPSGVCTYRGTALGEDFKDNLFSAQFNTHRILRHKLIRQGASFRTEDEIFFWNHNEDFHPTDVLEDADGSLLVVETGGWFIKGCPLSQVSKPELKGSIYRVRKKDAVKTDDAYGNAIKWNTSGAGELTKYMEDKRPFVADRAQHVLADKGKDAVAPLADFIGKSKSADGKVRAIFTLYRTNTAEGLSVIRKQLNDPDTTVKIAAARCVGMARDMESTEMLVSLLSMHQAAPVRRQAATALGQINDKKVSGALLAAAAGDSDRFINHAIIYSLISLKDPAAVVAGLTNTSERVQEAALIALDQMEGSPLQFEQLGKFLNSNHTKLQRTSLWIATHHPEWSAQLITFLNERFKDSLNADQENLVSNILVSFGADKKMQQFISQRIGTSDRSTKLLLLNAMGKVQQKEFPALWINNLSNLLADGNDAELKAKVVELIQLRSIKGLENKLQVVASDTKSPAPLRIQAIAALYKPTKKLSESHFQFLFQQMNGAGEASMKQQAASVLAASSLTETQLAKVADDYLPGAEPFILPRLIPAFSGEHSVAIGKSVANTLRTSPILDGFSEESITKLFEKYPAGVKPYVDSLMIKLKEVRSSRLQQLKEYEAALDEGVIDRGRVLFFGKATCSSCHTIGPNGGNMGPDLTSIQRDRSVHDLLEAIVYPSASFVREFETFKVKTNSGEHVGIIKSKSPESILLSTSPQSSLRINRSDIVSTTVHDVSMMPQGLDKLLTRREMADLMVFLLGQDQDPDTDSRILRHTSSNQ